MIPHSFINQFVNLCKHTYGTPITAAPEGPSLLSQIQNVANSLGGAHLIAKGKSHMAQSVGTALGASYPEAVVAFSLVRRAAGEMIPDSNEKEASPKKEWVVWSAGAAAGLTVWALSISLSYLASDASAELQAIAFMVKSAGMILGGMEGQAFIGQKTPASHPTRALQSLIARDLVEAVGRSIPVPLSLTLVASVVGVAMKTVAGVTGYYAEPLSHLAVEIYHREPSTTNPYNPGEVIKTVNQLCGEVFLGPQQLAAQLKCHLFVGGMAHSILKGVIEDKIATNVMVRSLNQYRKVVQDPQIQLAIEYFINPQAAIQGDVISLINNKIYDAAGLSMTEWAIVKIFQNRNSETIFAKVKQMTSQIQAGEIQLIGFALSNRDKMEQLLRVHAVCYLPLALIHLMRSTSTRLDDEAEKEPDLTEDEVHDFYLSANEILFSPYADYRWAKGIKKMIGYGLPFILKDKKIVPLLMEKIVQGEVAKYTPSDKAVSLKAQVRTQLFKVFRAFWDFFDKATRRLRGQIRSLQHAKRYAQMKKQELSTEKHRVPKEFSMSRTFLDSKKRRRS